ncbi:MAG: hypothetical protein ACK5A0_15305 [Polaromonas sp.]|jgi:hypothetical protein
MKSTLIASTVIAIAALTGASAFAQGNMAGEAAYVIPAQTFTSNTGHVAVSNEAAFAAVVATPSTLSRAEVREEASHWAIMDGSNRRIYR